MFTLFTHPLLVGLSVLTFSFACYRVAERPAEMTPEAAAVFFEAAPLDAQGDDALATVRRLDAEGRGTNGGRFPALPAQEHLRRAAIYIANRAFAEARTHWQTLVERYPNHENVPAALFGIGRSFYQERRYAEALPFFERLGRDHLNAKEGREGFYYVAATLLRRSRPADAATRYGEYAERFPQGERIENAYLNAIDSWREAGRKPEALQWIARTRERFTGTATETNALFARLRLDVAGSDWQTAIQTADELRTRSFGNGVQTTLPEVLYLRAYGLERAKQTAPAIVAYQAINDKLSAYYGGLATERLLSLGNAGKQAAATRLAGVRREAAAVAGNYPAPFREQLLQAVKGKQVDPRFVLAIMRQESSFNPRARSQAAARGLLQLTMDAATEYAPQTSIKSFVEEDLYRPDINIPLGVAYLSELSRTFPNLPEAVAASYNGGEDNVARWVERAGHTDNGVFTSEIGFAESKDYAMKVMANYRAYRLLYTADLRRQR
ncbi:hypothetical protein BH18ACI2_BH18ACI2_07420 [soil metagenome]